MKPVLIAGGLALVVLAVAGLFLAGRMQTSERLQRSLLAELKAIRPPKDCRMLKQDSVHKLAHVGAGEVYETSLSFEDLRAFYDKALADRGWKKATEDKGTKRTNPGRKVVRYTRGTCRATLDFYGAKAPSGGDFSINFFCPLP